jgi:hypothetical protein
MSALERLLRVLRIPFQKLKSSDELTEVRKMPAFFNRLCDLLLLQCPESGDVAICWESLRTDIADTITEIANQGVQEIKDAEPTSEDKLLYGTEMALPLLRFFQNGNRNLKAFRESQVPATLCKMLEQDSLDTSSTDTMISVLEALTAISYYQPIAQAVVELGVGRNLIHIINNSKDFRSYVVSLAIEALWNLIEVGGQVAIEALASYPEAIPSLKNQFAQVMSKGYKKDDKCLRNEICVLMNFIVGDPQSHENFLAGAESGSECILESIINWGVHDEQNANSTPIFTQTEEDLELKKLLWTQAFQVMRGPHAEKACDLAFKKKFFNTLLLFLDPKACQQNVILSRWAQPQLIELQTHALNILGNLVGIAQDRIYQLGGHRVLAVFLMTYEDKQRRRAVMQALLAICKHEQFRHELPMLIEPLI